MAVTGILARRVRLSQPPRYSRACQRCGAMHARTMRLLRRGTGPATSSSHIQRYRPRGPADRPACLRLGHLLDRIPKKWPGHLRPDTLHQVKPQLAAAVLGNAITMLQNSAARRPFLVIRFPAIRSVCLAEQVYHDTGRADTSISRPSSKHGHSGRSGLGLTKEVNRVCGGRQR